MAIHRFRRHAIPIPVTEIPSTIQHSTNDTNGERQTNTPPERTENPLGSLPPTRTSLTNQNNIPQISDRSHRMSRSLSLQRSVNSSLSSSLHGSRLIQLPQPPPPDGTSSDHTPGYARNTARILTAHHLNLSFPLQVRLFPLIFPRSTTTPSTVTSPIQSISRITYHHHHPNDLPSSNRSYDHPSFP